MNLIQRIDALLPQTQCGKCGHPGCMPYAEGIARGEAINKCPPGGQETLSGLARLLRIPEPPLDAERGPAPAQVAYIREAECIGCTKCIQACPVDAIVGAAKLMHTVLTDECTGCDLCVAPCPVDCIDLLPLPQALPHNPVVALVGDLARDSDTLQVRAHKRNHARLRHQRRNARLQRETELRQARAQRSMASASASASASANDLPVLGNAQDPAVKQARIALTMSRAQLNKSLKAFGHPPTFEQAMRLIQLTEQVQTAEQALARLEQAAPVIQERSAQAQAKNPAADLKRAKIQLAMARASLSKAQAAGACAEQLALLGTQVHNAEQAVNAAQ